MLVITAMMIKRKNNNNKNKNKQNKNIQNDVRVGYTLEIPGSEATGSARGSQNVIIYEGGYNKKEINKNKNKNNNNNRVQYRHPLHQILKENMGLSAPARAYLGVLTDGFDVEHHSAFVPYGSSNTQKITTRLTFECSTGDATGTGWVAFTPTPSNDRDTVQFTLSDYAGGAGFQRGATSIIGVNGEKMNTPYSRGTLVGTVGGESTYQWRLVAFSARMHYNGNELERNGNVYAVCHPRSDGFPETMAASQAYNSFQNTIKYNVGTTSTFEVHWSPQVDKQLELCDGNVTYPEGNAFYPSVTGGLISFWDYTSGGANAPDGSSFGFMMKTAVAASFTVECVAHWEFAGKDIGLLTTPTVADPGGVHLVKSIIAHGSVSHAANPQLSRAEHMQASIPKIAGMLEPDDAAAIAGLLGGAGAATAVGIGAKLYMDNAKPINKIVGSVVGNIGHMFGF